MARVTHRFSFPDRFVAGTIGTPGQRTFYLQARSASRLVSVVCEKQQVSILADHLERILDELTKLGADAIPGPVSRADDLGPLDQPLDEEFRVGTMTLAWDTAQECIAIELFSVVDMDADDESDAVEQTVENAEISMHVRLTPADARQFISRARALIVSGRPECPFCEQPINPEGHLCPRANGYRAPLFDDPDDDDPDDDDSDGFE
ncbi:DUF3090 domain-containing protein [Aestuariimicrobium sp. Y1814]|uniref:DUF3090 domain-containing protein n=1 Tax=Aestuariimicrobium sp. Y1814 TaxID=3418742 RepID=UPI003DA6E270